MQMTRAAAQAASATQAVVVAKKMMEQSTDYTSSLLSTVLFQPEAIQMRTEGTMVFPWMAKRGSHNGFKSVHGGALSTLADAFTKIHARAVTPEQPIRSVSFEISFLSAVFSEKKCNCITRIVNRTENIVFTDFSFEDADSGEVYARGTHVLSE